MDNEWAKREARMKETHPVDDLPVRGDYIGCDWNGAMKNAARLLTVLGAWNGLLSGLRIHKQLKIKLCHRYELSDTKFKEDRQQVVVT